MSRNPFGSRAFTVLEPRADPPSAIEEGLGHFSLGVFLVEFFDTFVILLRVRFPALLLAYLVVVFVMMKVVVDGTAPRQQRPRKKHIKKWMS